MNGGGSRLAITELQTDVIGFFDFTAPPQHDKHEEGSAWEISFDYIVRFDKPSAIQIAYPLLVHQQMLPEHWFNTHGAYRPWLRPKRSSASRRAFDAVCNQTKPAASDNVGGMQYPTYDDWYPLIKQKDTNSILRVLCSIDPADRKYIERFNGFGIFDINPRFLAFMRKHYQYVFKKEESPFVLELWDGWDLIDPTQIETNAALGRRTAAVIDPVLGDPGGAALGAETEVAAHIKGHHDLCLHGPVAVIQVTVGRHIQAAVEPQRRTPAQVEQARA